MLTYEYLNDTNNSERVKRLTEMSIAMVGLLTLQEISSLEELIVSYESGILEDISLATSYTTLLLDNVTNISKHHFLESLTNVIYEPKDWATNLLGYEEFKSVVKSMQDKLTTFKDSLEVSYSLASGTLSIYNTDSSEAGINYAELKKTSYTISNYYNNKLMLKNILLVSTDFAQKSSDSVLADQSLNYSFLDKMEMILTDTALTLRKKLQIINTLEDIIDSCYIAKRTIAGAFLNTNVKVALFVNRGYNEIYIDIKKIFEQ